MFLTLRKHKGAFLVAAAVNVGSILFGFDTGVIGATVSLASFKRDFNLSTSTAIYTAASSNIVAVLNAGAFFGALAPPLFSKWLGRKIMLLIAGFFFLVGGVLQTAAQGPSLSMLYTGRVIAGLGVGMISNTAPVFVAECAPKELRGLMMSAFEMFLVSGGMLAYWTVYGCSIHLADTSKQWRTPLSLQIILAVFVILSSFIVPESPRWLAKRGDWDAAVESLCYLRGEHADSSEIGIEIAEIRAQIDEEILATNGRSIKEMTSRKNVQRLLWALGVGVFAMWCGHNAILYYGPTVFVQIGFTGQNSSLLASGVFTVIKFVSTIIFITGGVHIVGRRTLMLAGAVLMGCFLSALGAVLKSYPPSVDGNGSGSTSAKAMMAMVYLFVVAYSLSWGPLQWIFIGEIFPTRVRDYGMAAGAMMIWLMNYIVSKIAPIAVVNIGWKTWMIFGTMNICAAIFTWFLPETKDISLEEMDVLFGVVDESVRKHDIEKNLTKEVVITMGRT